MQESLHEHFARVVGSGCMNGRWQQLANVGEVSYVSQQNWSIGAAGQAQALYGVQDFNTA